MRLIIDNSYYQKLCQKNSVLLTNIFLNHFINLYFEILGFCDIIILKFRSSPSILIKGSSIWLAFNKPGYKLAILFGFSEIQSCKTSSHIATNIYFCTS